MGGLAFSTPGPDGSPPLHVPRMPTETYNELKKESTEILQRFYKIVATPCEAPGKDNHGDIDFLVEGALHQFTPDDVARELSAIRHVKNGATRSYAIPHPYEEDAFVQVDVHLCLEDRLRWDYFMNSYSDLMQIVGVIHRPLGITVNDKGMHVRVEEMEGSNRKASMVFLTDDPTSVMHFMGLDVDKYYLGFQCEEELFEWISSGRFFSPLKLRERTEKSNDRRRLNARGMYRRYLNDWLVLQEDTVRMGWTRCEVLTEALNAFRRYHEYNTKLKAHRIKQWEAALWDQIKKRIPLEGDRLGLVLKALKIWVDFDNRHPYIRDEPQVDPTARPIWIIKRTTDREEGIDDCETEEILKWVESHWERVKLLEKARQSDAKHVRQVKKTKLDTTAQVDT